MRCTRSERAIRRCPPVITVLALSVVLSVPEARSATRIVPDSFITIQAAIDACGVGDTVLVRSGTYRGIGNRNLNCHGTELVLRSEAGAEETIIDCERGGRGLYFESGESRAACVEGLTILNGDAVPEQPWEAAGGGIMCGLSSPTIRDCRIINCRGWYRGGGVYLLCSYGRLERCTMSQNESDDGGGLALECGRPEIEACVIAGNRSDYYGGGVSFAGWIEEARLVSCTITANVGPRSGGLYGGYVQLDRCILWGNCAPGHPEYNEAQAHGITFNCCVVDTTGIDANMVYGDDSVFTDPGFCAPAPCGQHSEGDWTVSDLSPCLPQNNVCGVLIGALDQGCTVTPPTGACCLFDGSCHTESEQECDSLGGAYQGDGGVCEPNPCEPIPVQRTSWGQVKAHYHGGGR